MPAPAVEFLGQAYGAPIVASAFFAKPQPSGLGVDLNIQIIIGPADNGWHCNDATLPMDKRVMEFRTTQEADAVLGAGDLLDAIHAAKTPSQDSRFASGPVRILALNTRANTAATAALAHAGAGQYTLRANVPGPRGNTVRIRVADSGDTLEMMNAGSQFRESGLARDDLTIQYVGDATTAALAFDGANLRVTLAGDQTDGTTDLDIDISAVPTIRDLAERISVQPGYQATWLSNQDLRSEHLDHIGGLDVKTAPTILRAMFWRQNSRIRAWGYCAAIEPTGGRYPLIDTPAFVYLAGGARGPETAADYLDALDLQSTQNGFYLNVCSSVTAVHAKLFEVVVRGNSPRGSRERFGGCGADVTLPIADRYAAGKALNSEYMAYGASPVTMFRADGITRKTYDGWMLAVLHNAIKAGANVRETAFSKDLAILDAPEAAKVDVAKAIQNGCMVVDRKTTGAYRIGFDTTTYSGTNLILNKAQLVCLALAINKDLREFLEANFQGEVPTDPRARGTVLTMTKIRKAIRNRFDRTYVREFGWLSANEFTGEAAFDENFLLIKDAGNVLRMIMRDGKLVTSLDFIFSILNFDTIRGSSG
jgi:hypothetical protein